MKGESRTGGPAVIVMARAPRPGEGKSRLRTALSDEECVRLQEAFLRDAVEVALASGVGPVYVAYTPAYAAPWVEAEFGGRAAVFPQDGEGLGPRILAALRRVQAEGFAPLLVTGTDTPLLQPEHLRQALSDLAEVDLCLGPSADGGYYLLACRSPLPQLFQDVPWGTERVLDTTLRLAAQSGLRYSLLETLHDVDTPQDLARLRDHLARTASRPAARLPRNTAEVVFSLSHSGRSRSNAPAVIPQH